MIRLAHRFRVVDQAGMSLAEILIACVIIAIGLVGLLSAVPTASFASSSLRMMRPTLSGPKNSGAGSVPARCVERLTTPVSRQVTGAGVHGCGYVPRALCLVGPPPPLARLQTPHLSQCMPASAGIRGRYLNLAFRDRIRELHRRLRPTR